MLAVAMHGGRVGEVIERGTVEGRKEAVGGDHEGVWT